MKQVTFDCKRNPRLGYIVYRDLELPMLLPGIKVGTSPTDYYPVQQLQLMRFNGKR
jgi:hypothetical protein